MLGFNAPTIDLHCRSRFGSGGEVFLLFLAGGGLMSCVVRHGTIIIMHRMMTARSRNVNQLSESVSCVFLSFSEDIFRIQNKPEIKNITRTRKQPFDRSTMTAATATDPLPNVTNKTSWAVDIDADPLQVAIVYDSLKNPVHCGHAVPLRRLVQRVLLVPVAAGSGSSGNRISNPSGSSSSVCPICQTPIAYVTDSNKKEEPTVVFKFNKQVYRLTVPSSLSYSDSSPDERPQWRQQLLQLGSGHADTDDTTTAQGRIAAVLHMSVDRGMKVCIMLLLCIS